MESISNDSNTIVENNKIVAIGSNANNRNNGCKNVDSAGNKIGDNSDTDNESEEVLVYIDFPAFEDSDLLTPDKVIAISDLESASPRCEIGKLSFIGSYEVNIGSQLFLRNDTSAEELLRSVGTSISILKFELDHIRTKSKNSSI